MKITIRILTAILAVLLITGLCSCGLSRGVHESDAYYSEVSVAPEDLEMTADEAEFGYSMNEEKSKETGTDATDYAMDAAARKRIYYVSITTQTQEFDAAVSSVKQAVAEYGGYMQNASVSGKTGFRNTRTATYQIRIPTENLAAFREAIGTCLTMIDENERVDDVTARYTDMESRLKTLRTEQESLYGLLEKAETMDEILMIRDRLTSVTSDIEAFEAQLRTFDSLIAYSTVTLSIDEVERITVKEEKTAFGRIGENFSENLAAVGNFFVELFVWFVSAIPVLLVIALFVGVILWIIFGSIHHAKKKKAKKAASVVPEHPKTETNEK